MFAEKQLIFGNVKKTKQKEAFPDYALPAWEFNACGFMVKLLTLEKVGGEPTGCGIPFPQEYGTEIIT